jgi:hypothetical protein
VAVVVVAHDEYRDADWGIIGSVMRRRILIDCRRALEADALRLVGFTYRALGVAALR